MDAIPTAAQDALRYEKTNWANGSVFDQEFYQVPPRVDGDKELPGAPLKVEHETDTSKYLLPPMTSMSRFIYQSENLLGLSVPASAAILWPYSPKTHTDGKYPVIAWAHGTSGIFAENAPSNHRSLWQHFLAPYQLVSAGYAVVMPDYAGLGVSKTAKGEKIVHQYLACPAHANDVVFAVQAAQSVWKDELSKDWVVIGHSQGGGAAWAVAERQARKPVDGYLGAVAVSPFTTLYELEDPFCSVLAHAMTPGWVDWDEEEKSSNLVTEDGRKRLKIIEEIGAGTSASLPLLLADGLMKPGWQLNRAFRNFLEEVENGGKEIGGPLLVIHGETDERLCIDATANAVANTAQDWPESRLEFIRLPGVSHVPALQAGQRVWMDWIADRFAGREVKQGVTTMTLKTARPGRSYQKEHNWYLEAATEPFHAP
ncbi:MAG: hypothetical protein L6R42_004404 [Xanthoria sp. 1 TBL-2021]|nr:MAG: hypothetical protein L6R42_004404 [Xanthoria sp. 1 TBL-2021]